MTNAYVIFQRDQFLLIRDSMELQTAYNEELKENVWQWHVDMAVENMAYSEANIQHVTRVVQKLAERKETRWEKVSFDSDQQLLGCMPSWTEEVIQFVKTMCKFYAQFRLK